MPKRTNAAIKEYQTKSGTRFKFQTYIGIDPNTKKNKQVTRQGFKSYSEANQEFNRLRLNGVQSEFKTTTLNELRDIWYNEAYFSTVRESTAKKFEEYYRLNLSKTLGFLDINQIKLTQWQKFANDMAKKYVNYKVGLRNIRRMYDYAIGLKMTKSNPMREITWPSATSRPRRDTSHNFYEKEEVEEFLKTAQDVSDEAYLYFHILAGTGLRRAEALALYWTDIDFSKCQVNVNKTIALDKDNKAFEQPFTKTEAGMRIIPVPPQIVRELKEYQKINGKFKRIFSTQYDNFQPLTKPQTWMDLVYARNDKLRHITVHGFRHTYASLVYVSDPRIKPTDMKYLLGHETVEISLDIYTHVTNKSKERIRDTINHFDI